MTDFKAGVFTDNYQYSALGECY